jgi:hypothetical protein
MHEVPRDRLGTALRRLAADLVTERRHVLALRRENQELRAQLKAFGRIPPEAPESSKKRRAAGG